MSIEYVKHSYHRKKQYQIRTIIRNNKVEKHPVYAEGMSHIKKMAENYNLLLKTYNNISLCRNSLHDQYIEFEYITGQTLNERLLNLSNSYNKNLFLTEIASVIERIYRISDKIPFSYSAEFSEVFGDQLKEMPNDYKMESFLHSNIDINFDNIIESDKDFNWYMVDYEWVYSFPVPIRYIQFRSLLYFYTANSMILQEFILFEEILDHLEFTDLEVKTFQNMDEHFIKTITDKSYSLNRFSKKSVNLDLETALHKSGEDYYSQLYIVNSDGMIFENNSLKKPILLPGNSPQQISQVFDGLNFSETYGFRFDPLNSSCLVEINNVYCVIDERKYSLSYSHMNAFLVDENRMLFLSKDPQIYIYLDNIKEVSRDFQFNLIIDYTIVDVEITESHYYLPFMKRYKEIIDMNTKLNSEKKVLLEEQISLSQLIENKNMQIETLQDSLQFTQQENDIYIEKLDIKICEIHELNERIESMKFKNRIKKIFRR
ncbi:hypothetical protein [Paenibacillus sp. Mc5Re-14]|uniref:hypothetical protein n=1 Tax=Paenibacillus sp. Mc5Re-14 TaxID=1030529 RepID=UPI000A9A5436|nr:hypothetical protein [Paenibacillus sp. Mc5Re-14]